LAQQRLEDASTQGDDESAAHEAQHDQQLWKQYDRMAWLTMQWPSSGVGMNAQG
jgi:hypothetical protein